MNCNKCGSERPHRSRFLTGGQRYKCNNTAVIRHSKAMHLLRANVDLNYIRDFLGHVNTSTTEVYAKADAEMKRKALEKVHFDMPLESQTTWQKNESLMS